MLQREALMGEGGGAAAVLAPPLRSLRHEIA